MHTDSLIQLSRAINAAFEAAVVPALILLGAALVIMAAVEIRAQVRRRRRRAARKVRMARQTRVERARGADTRRLMERERRARWRGNQRGTRSVRRAEGLWPGPRARHAQRARLSA